MIPSGNVWHPKGRAALKPALSPEPLDPAEPADIDQEDTKLPDVDEEQLANEEAELSDVEFYQSLRRDVVGCREGSVPSITDAMRPPLKDRPWSKKRYPRDRYGNRLY